MFSRDNFPTTMERYCRDLGWKIVDGNPDVAIVEFSMGSGRTRWLALSRREAGLRFEVPSLAHFAFVGEIPPYLSVLILRRNFQLEIGFWCIQEINNESFFSCIHNAEWQLISAEYLRHAVGALINECEDFEKTLKIS